MIRSNQRHIDELSQRLLEAEATIAALVTGQVVALIDGWRMVPTGGGESRG